ncbi:GvpL/GvpF family gas vesicle protein [Actinomadura sp. GC306]|uniref:GvpL/GvpF family gas vesicle protein n=1 Tax=Actinomadura sp. GC306 TaxID=2530367 RepID=UPI001042887F|nr:GvpL/GvpF family gas vesicle protein [Actinomadura sp. GC306]TDC58827.1 GvpL/GvpF family gas vesicle protein [Actinomadura sp. GC306]
MTTPQTPGGNGPGDAPQDDRAPQYVYGVTRSGATLPGDVLGLDDKPVTMIEDGGVCAAIVSDLPQGRALGERADLVAHQRVLNALVDAGTVVLPFRFGAALADRGAVEKELLAGNSERFGRILEQLDGTVELRVKATYVQDTVLREIMAADPDIAELSQRLREVPADAADAVYYDRVRLGELIAQTMERMRESDGQALLDGAAGAAEAAVTKTPAREEDVLDASFLVRADRRAEFEQAVEELSREHGERIKVRLIGPLPPYDFVPEE